MHSSFLVLFALLFSGSHGVITTLFNVQWWQWGATPRITGNADQGINRIHFACLWRRAGYYERQGGTECDGNRQSMTANNGEFNHIFCGGQQNCRDRDGLIIWMSDTNTLNVTLLQLASANGKKIYPSQLNRNSVQGGVQYFSEWSRYQAQRIFTNITLYANRVETCFRQGGCYRPQQRVFQTQTEVDLMSTTSGSFIFNSQVSFRGDNPQAGTTYVVAMDFNARSAWRDGFSVRVELFRNGTLSTQPTCGIYITRNQVQVRPTYMNFSMAGVTQATVVISHGTSSGWSAAMVSGLREMSNGRFILDTYGNNESANSADPSAQIGSMEFADVRVAAKGTFSTDVGQIRLEYAGFSTGFIDTTLTRSPTGPPTLTPQSAMEIYGATFDMRNAQTSVVVVGALIVSCCIGAIVYKAGDWCGLESSR